MKGNTTRATKAIILFMALSMAGCTKAKNPLANTAWRFSYNDNDYTVISFSDFYFSITDYRIDADTGAAKFYEVSGSYKLDGETFSLVGENGKISIDGKTVSNPALRDGWNGVYSFILGGDRLTLTRDGASVTFFRVRMY